MQASAGGDAEPIRAISHRLDRVRSPSGPSALVAPNLRLHRKTGRLGVPRRSLGEVGRCDPPLLRQNFGVVAADIPGHKISDNPSDSRGNLMRTLIDHYHDWEFLNLGCTTK